jgi:hypothetical protein
MYKLVLLSVAVLAFCDQAMADAKIDLGDVQRVTRLFSYPNNCHVICFLNWTLEQTAEHYLIQSVRRDGYDKAQVSVSRDNDHLQAQITDVPATYAEPLRKLLDSGELAYRGATQLNKDGKWKFDWYFFLPLGMALENRRSIQLLHFPPDYVLTKVQDYLVAATTVRWAELLTFNGVAAAQTSEYQVIIDIAPIAAPSDAGKELEGTYDYFNDFQVDILTGPNEFFSILPVTEFSASFTKIFIAFFKQENRIVNEFCLEKICFV